MLLVIKIEEAILLAYIVKFPTREDFPIDILYRLFSDTVFLNLCHIMGPYLRSRWLPAVQRLVGLVTIASKGLSNAF